MCYLDIRSHELEPHDSSETSVVSYVHLPRLKATQTQMGMRGGLHQGANYPNRFWNGSNVGLNTTLWTMAPVTCMLL